MNEQARIAGPAPTERELEARRKRRIAIVVGIFVVAAALVAAFLAFSGGDEGPSGPEAAQSRGDGQAPTVTVIVPGQSEIGRTVIASGSLAARRDQTVGVAGQGGQVTRVLVEQGSWVQQGALLASIERSVQSQQAAGQRASIDRARADAELARQELQRSEALVERGFVSQADIDRKRAAYDAAVAQVRIAQAQLNQTQAGINLLDIRAPTAGLILDRDIEVGEVVGPQTAAFRMARGGEMELRANVSQQDLEFITVGMPASVTPVGSDTSFEGRVWQVEPTIDPQSRQGEVRIAIPYDPKIRPGGFAEAKIGAGASSAPLLPQSAVLADARGNYVYIVNSDNEVERRDVQIGTVDDRGVTITSGIDGTERIVARAGSFLTEGRRVSPVRQAAR